MTTDAEIWSALIAGAAFVLAAASLLVQWVMWRRTGVQLKVRCFYGIIVGDENRDVLTISASNTGRGTAQISSVSLDVKGQERRWWPANTFVSGSADLPVRIEGAHQVSWHAPIEALEELAHKHSVRQVRPRVELGSGATYCGDWIPVGD